MFHKGNSSSYPNRAPGVWIHPDKNAVRVYMNTQDNILEYADIDNIPMSKWVYMNIILNNKYYSLFLNYFNLLYFNLYDKKITPGFHQRTNMLKTCGKTITITLSLIIIYIFIPNKHITIVCIYSRSTSVTRNTFCPAE